MTLQVTFGGVDDIRHECDGGNTRRPGQTAFIAQQIDPTHPLRGMVHTQASAAVSYAATANMLEVNKASARIIPSGAVRDLLEKYKASLRWAVANLRSVNRSIWSVPVAGALVYAHHVSPVATEAFGAQVRTGIGLQVNSPALVLRDYLTGGANREYHKRRYAEDRTVIAIKTLTAAWHAEHGRSLGRLHASETALRYYRELAGDA